MKRKTPKKLSAWKAADFRREAARVNRSKVGSDETLCGAVLLAAARDGARITKVAKALDVKPDAIRWMFDNYRRSGVFTSRGQVRADWSGENGGISYCVDVAVGMGLLERAP